jgi:hypothetical protein
VIDASTGSPVTLGYGLETTRTTTSSGTLASVSVPTKGHTLPAMMRVHLVIDATSVAHATVASP